MKKKILRRSWVEKVYTIEELIEVDENENENETVLLVFDTEKKITGRGFITEEEVDETHWIVKKWREKCLKE